MHNEDRLHLFIFVFLRFVLKCTLYEWRCANMHNLKILIGKKIRQIRDKHNLSQEQFVEMLGIEMSRTQISRIESGANMPSAEFVKAVSDNFGVSCDSILSDREELSYSTTQSFNSEELTVLKLYNRLTSQDKDTVKSFMDIACQYNEARGALSSYINSGISSAKSFDYVVAKEDEEYKLVPRLGNVAAGLPIEMHIAHTDHVAARKNIDFALVIKGDSMEPDIPNGSTVYIHKQDTLENSEIGIIAVDGEVTCKKFYKTDSYVELRSINPKYKPIIVKDNTIRILGKVIK